MGNNTGFITPLVVLFPVSDTRTNRVV